MWFSLGKRGKPKRPVRKIHERRRRRDWGGIGPEHASVTSLVTMMGKHVTIPMLTGRTKNSKDKMPWIKAWIRGRRVELYTTHRSAGHPCASEILLTLNQTAVAHSSSPDFSTFPCWLRKKKSNLIWSLVTFSGQMSWAPGKQLLSPSEDFPNRAVRSWKR